MGSGTAVAKEAADVVLLDDDFGAVPAALLAGRGVFAGVQKFLSFQLAANVVAVSLAVGGAVADAESPLTATQLLWVNLIIDSLAALALAAEPPPPVLMERPPFAADAGALAPGGGAARHVTGQALYQLASAGALLAWGPALLSIPPHVPLAGPSVHHTLVFNAFVCMSLANQLNARAADDSADVGDGLFDPGARLFLAVLGVELAMQVALVQWGGRAFGAAPLDAGLWALCAGLGGGSLLVREALRRPGAPPAGAPPPPRGD